MTLIQHFPIQCRRKSVEDILAGSSEAIDNNLNTVLAKVSPALLRRRSPSPATSTKTPPQPTRDSQGSSSGGGVSTLTSAAGGGGGAGNTFPLASGSTITSTAVNKSDSHLLSPFLEETDGAKGSKSSSDGSSQHSSSPSDSSQLNPGGGALSKCPSTGSLGKAAKNKVPTQAKKKSWYSVFYPSYKSRSADFKKLFKDVPDEERLLVGETRLFIMIVIVAGDWTGRRRRKG